MFVCVCEYVCMYECRMCMRVYVRTYTYSLMLNHVRLFGHTSASHRASVQPYLDYITEEHRGETKKKKLRKRCLDEDTEVQQDVQRVEHLRDSVCFHTALFHRCARQADGSSEKPTPARQHDIKIQEEAVRAQPGDARGSAVRSWVLDDHRRAGWQMGMVVPRGETSETPDPVL